MFERTLEQFAQLGGQVGVFGGELQRRARVESEQIGPGTALMIRELALFAGAVEVADVAPVVRRQSADAARANQLRVHAIQNRALLAGFEHRWVERERD